LTAVFVLVVEFLAPFILRVLIGADFTAAVPAVRIVLLAAPAYVVYIVLRNVLDALHIRPLNAKNLGLAVLLFAFISFAWGSAAAVPWAVLASVLLLGALSARDAHVCLGGRVSTAGPSSGAEPR
jgi:O-antigen/teichoic acid export membrane protein